jgi:hypothetical protein
MSESNQSGNGESIDIESKQRSNLSPRESAILGAIKEARGEVGIIEAERLKFWPAGEYRSDDPDLVALSGEYPEVPAAPEFDLAGKPAYQVREEFDAALTEALPAGINIEHLGGMVTGFYGEPEAVTDGGSDEYEAGWSIPEVAGCERGTFEFLIHRKSTIGAYLLRIPEGEESNPEAAETYYDFGSDSDFRGADLGMVVSDLEHAFDGRRTSGGFGDVPVGRLLLDAETLMPVRIIINRIGFVRDAWLREDSFGNLLGDWQTMVKGEALKRAGEGTTLSARFYVKGVGRIDGRLELSEVYCPERIEDAIGGWHEGGVSGVIYTQDGKVYDLSLYEEEPGEFSNGTVSRIIENLDAPEGSVIDWDYEPLGAGRGNLMGWQPLPSEEALSEETHARASPEESLERYGSDDDGEDENGEESLMTDGGSELVWFSECCGIEYRFGGEEPPEEVECVGVECGEELSFDRVPDDRDAEVITDGGERVLGEGEMHVPEDDAVVLSDGGRDEIPVVSGCGISFSGPGDELRRCPECDTINNIMVNDSRCYKCGHQWGTPVDGEAELMRS